MEANWLTMQLPYLAPWVEEGNGEHLQPMSNTKRQNYGTISSTTYREDPYMTANMPYLAPWSDGDSIAADTESNDIVPSPPPLAHLPGRSTGGNCTLSSRTSIEEQTR